MNTVNLQFDDTIQRALKQALRSNGCIGVGLTLAGEVGIDQIRKIPLPKNVLAFDASSASHLASLARQSADKYRQLNDASKIGLDWLAESVRMSILTGNVCLKRMPPEPYPDTVAGLSALQWDAEVNIIDEEFSVPDLKRSVDQIRADLPSDLSVAQSVIAMVFASKITWWVTGHHLGVKIAVSARPRGRATARAYYGFTEKVCRALGGQEFDMSDEESATRVHNLVHAWSTRAVWASLWATKQTITKPAQVFGVPFVLRDTHKAAFLPLEFGDDVMLRLSSFGSGWAALSDLKSAISIMSHTPLFVHNPGVGQIVDLCDKYSQVAKDPLGYGLSSAYLTDTGKDSRFDRGPYAVLISAITVWLRTFMPNSSIARATPFIGEPAEMDGYNDSWAQMCASARTAQIQSLKVTPQAMIDLFTATGHMAVGAVPVGLVAAMTNIGVSITDADLQRSIDALRGKKPLAPSVAQTGPSNPPGPPPGGPGGGGAGGAGGSGSAGGGTGGSGSGGPTSGPPGGPSGGSGGPSGSGGGSGSGSGGPGGGGSGGQGSGGGSSSGQGGGGMSGPGGSGGVGSGSGGGATGTGAHGSLGAGGAGGGGGNGTGITAGSKQGAGSTPLTSTSSTTGSVSLSTSTSSPSQTHSGSATAKSRLPRPTLARTDSAATPRPKPVRSSSATFVSDQDYQQPTLDDAGARQSAGHESQSLFYQTARPTLEDQRDGSGAGQDQQLRTGLLASASGDAGMPTEGADGKSGGGADDKSGGGAHAEPDVRQGLEALRDVNNIFYDRQRMRKTLAHGITPGKTIDEVQEQLKVVFKGSVLKGLSKKQRGQIKTELRAKLSWLHSQAVQQAH